MSVHDRRTRMLPRVQASCSAALGLFLVLQLGGCGREPEPTSPPPTPKPAHKLSIVEPKPNQAGTIKVRPGKKAPCLVRFEHDGTVKSPGAVLVGLTRGETYSGQYLAEPRTVDDRTFEFKVEIEIPASRGKYLLTASLNPLGPGQESITTTQNVNVE